MPDSPHYFTNCGPISGPILDHDRSVPGSIGIHDSPTNFMPCGEASGFTRDDQGRTVFRLVVNKVAVPGRWVVIDRGFVRVEGQGP